MISKLTLHRLFLISTRSTYRFILKVTSCSLSTTDSLINNWFKVQPIKRIPLGPMRGWGPFSRPMFYIREQPIYCGQK